MTFEGIANPTLKDKMLLQVAMLVFLFLARIHFPTTKSNAAIIR